MLTCLCALGMMLGLLGPAPAKAGVSYVAATWNDQSIHLLDHDLNDLGSFTVGSSLPNGIATDGMRIWAGFFTTNEVISYDFTGTELFRFDLGFDGVALQGMELLPSGALAVMDAFANVIRFYHAFPVLTSQTFHQSRCRRRVWRMRTAISANWWTRASC